ncbi:4-alpha-glucanotransferase [Corynebacterium sp. HMSC055G02]|uniref:4-alpha-glucanotransferase n=1 Tax=unclassified Corynebacterium TaxID=2624378 RepID=UPI0008A2683F|nr:MULTISPECIES: 4-alpha-glucanotransferase [unclassified Corynebacterium]MBC6830578.1 4-alpha-glucanotransferase [Corynebacterium sp. LK32]MBS5168066.1 4-alpha-glucanotransferase [Corynebacterium sp.]OFN54285.1 4-alpha-glucanotransferase [Corynebacterium sp. HMSC055G02]
MMERVTQAASNPPLSSPLADLAKDVGVGVSYYSTEGQLVHVSRETVLKTLAALDIDLGPDPSDADINDARREWADTQWSRLLPPVVVTRQGIFHRVLVHVPHGSNVSVTVKLEDGAEWPCAQVHHLVPPRQVGDVLMGEAAFAIPEDLPLGWHRLRAVNDDNVAECDVAVTPNRLATADKYVQNPAHGVMAQLYSVRSSRSWGIGDFATLGDLAQVSAEHAGSDFVLINPLHAAEPLPPVEDSPYLPTTRRYVNPLYARPELIDEFGYLDKDEADEARALANSFHQLNHSPDEIDRNPIYAAKLKVLRAIHKIPLSSARQAEFDRWLEAEGRGIYDYASWCTERELADRAAARDAARAATSDSGAVTENDIELVPPLGNHASVESLREEIFQFHLWVQWILDQQLGQAQEAALDAGMRIGIMADLAVGVHPGGADAENLADWLAPAISVGAPPDGFNQRGQDWSQPPWNPHKLAEAGYRPWRDMLRTILRHAGGIRVDHVLGMFRLWVMPRMESPVNGTYLYFDHEAMVGILALEAELAGAVVVGEDLGTFEPWVQDYLASRGIMGTSIVWFESEGDQPKPPSAYRSLCLSSVTTHDLPPTAGYLAGEHIKLRERLRLLLSDVAEEDRRDFEWIRKVLGAAKEAGCFGDTAAADMDVHSLTRDNLPTIDALVTGLHRFLDQTPSALKCEALVDMVGDRRTQNQPGTSHDQYPNWCIPLTDAEGKAVLVEDLPRFPGFKR